MELIFVCDDEGLLRKMYGRVLSSVVDVRSALRIEPLLELVNGVVAEGRVFWLLLDGDIKIYEGDVERPELRTGSETGQDALKRVKEFLAVQGRLDLLQGVLFCSGNPGYESIVLPLGTLECPVRFLAKPCGAQELRDAVQRLLNS